MANLVAARLENSTIVLVTRAWPVFVLPLPVIPRIIDANELRFTPEETREFLAGAGLEAGADAAGQIYRYVSGWPIALSLVALALRRGGPGALGDGDLSATKPALYALFEREIFSQYTPAEQDLLVKLSVLDSFPRGLVQAVTGERERDLGQLLGGNIFIGYNADTMRLSFHAMYREFLQEMLLGMGRDEREATYRKAAEWCRSNKHYYDAVNYYEQCGDYGEIWDTLQLMDAGRHTKSEGEFFIGCLQRLPTDFKRRHPMTGIVMAAMLINNLRIAEAAQALDAVQSDLDGAPSGGETDALWGEYHIARGFVTLAMEQNGFEVHFKRAAALLPEGSRRWGRGLLLIDLGPGLNLQSARAGELKKSLACFAEGVPHMAKVLHGAGQGLDRLCECEALFLTGEVKKAAEPAYQALYAAQAAAQYDICGSALFMLLRIYLALGDDAQLLDTMEHVERYARDGEARNLGIWDIARGWLHAEMGEVEKVALWIRNPVQKGFAPISIDRALLVRLRCLVAAGQYAEALALLEPLEALAGGKGAVITLLYAKLGRAVACHSLGRAADAAAALKAAYALAKGNRLFMPFAEYGSRARSLFERVRQMPGHGVPQDWLDDMHARASTYAKRHAYLAGRYRQRQQGGQTDYGLSRRETELLVNLSQGLTREEMADSMELSLNTVKSLTRQTFAKLGAINAADAVRIAILNRLI